MQLFYDLLTITVISSSLATQKKKKEGPPPSKRPEDDVDGHIWPLGRSLPLPELRPYENQVWVPFH